MDSAATPEYSDPFLNELLASNLGETTRGAQLTRKENYTRYVALRNVTSYSIENILSACARKFQLTKLRADNKLVTDDDGEIVQDEDQSATFAFGHAVGAGVAAYDKTLDINQAVWACFLAWNADLFATVPQKERRQDPKKSFAHAVWAIQTYSTFHSEELDAEDYEVEGVESTIAVMFPAQEEGRNPHFYVGHIDELWKHRLYNRRKIKENKTTVYATVDPAIYANSNQALSYSLVIDSVGETEFDVLYTIYSSTEQRWMKFEFTKTAFSKAEWAQTQFCTIETLQMYSDLNFFPKNGNSCVQFGRRCQFYEECDYHSLKVFGKKFSDLETAQSFADLEQIERIDYAFNIEDILNRQKEIARGN